MSRVPGNNVIGEAVINIRAQGAEQVATETQKAKASVEDFGRSQSTANGAIGRTVEGLKDFGRTSLGVFTRAIGVVGGFIGVLGTAFTAGRALSEAIIGVDEQWQEFERRLAKGSATDNLAAAREQMLALQNTLASINTDAAAQGSVARTLAEQKIKERVAFLQQVIDDSQRLIAASQARADREQERTRTQAARAANAERLRLTEERIKDEAAAATGAEERLQRERQKNLSEVIRLAGDDADRARLVALVEYTFALRKRKLEEENAEEEKRVLERIKAEYKARQNAQAALDKMMAETLRSFSQQIDSLTNRLATSAAGPADEMVRLLKDIARNQYRGP